VKQNPCQKIHAKILDPGIVHLREIPDERHNTIQDRQPEALAKALSEAGN
jgi:hypothetical protein